MKKEKQEKKTKQINIFENLVFLFNSETIRMRAYFHRVRLFQQKKKRFFNVVGEEIYGENKGKKYFNNNSDML